MVLHQPVETAEPEMKAGKMSVRLLLLRKVVYAIRSEIRDLPKLLIFFLMVFASTASACTMVGNANRPPEAERVISPPPPTVTCEPGESRIVCEDRWASQRITPLPPHTPSASFLTAEAEYRQSLVRLTLTPEPPTPTPTPSWLVLQGQKEGMLLYRGRSAYQEHPRFEIEYAEDKWRLEGIHSDPVLVHNTIEGCRLFLRAGGMGMKEAPIIMQQEFAGYLVEVREFRQTGVISYGFSIDRSYYAFVLFFPPSAAQSVIAECRSAGEIVLDTFRLIQE
jgi:hypothetical protein